jgi:hypothetical protein
VISLHDFSSKIHKEEIPVNPGVIFRRILYIKKSDEKLKNYFELEQAPYPLKLF